MNEKFRFFFRLFRMSLPQNDTKMATATRRTSFQLNKINDDDDDDDDGKKYIYTK